MLNGVMSSLYNFSLVAYEVLIFLHRWGDNHNGFAGRKFISCSTVDADEKDS